MGKYRKNFIYIFCTLLIASTSAFAQARKKNDTLSTSDWAGIRAAYEESRHRVHETNDGLIAWNPGQDWQTRFDDRGFVAEPKDEPWRWGLALQSYGVKGAEQKVGLFKNRNSQSNLVTYQWDDNLSEWFVNDKKGLEHGFTIQRRPQGSRDGQNSFLFLTLKVRGPLMPQLSKGGDEIHFLDDKKVNRLIYNKLFVTDALGKHIPAHFALSSDDNRSHSIKIVINDQKAQYPLTIDPIAQQAYLKASNTGINDEFGLSVAIDGDTVVVAARGEDSNETGVNGDGQADNSASLAGAVYVFVRSGSTWSQQAYLKASNTDAADLFGFSVAINGDTVAVGAPEEDSNETGVNGDDQADNSAADAGAVYVFVRSGSAWSQQAYLKASNTDARDVFGFSVAIDADSVIVGAPDEDSMETGVDGADQADNSAINAGAVYAFVRSGSTWSQQAYLKASNTDGGDNFGFSVAIDGDTVAVGARFEDSNGTGVNGDEANDSATDAGAAYVFVRSDNTWSQQAYLKASNTDANDFFGGFVDIDSDTVVVGAFKEDSNETGVNGDDQADNSAEDSGAVYVFVRLTNMIWSQLAYLKASNAEGGDSFGTAVALDGDTVVAGASFEDSAATGVNNDQSNNDATESGAAYIFVIDRCGDGFREASELCDDGNLTNGDGCDSSCEPECVDPQADCAPVDACVNAICDENQTTGAAVCDTTSQPDGTSCNDNNECTQDTCQQGVCVGAPGNEGETCTSDDDRCTDDICRGGSCIHVRDTNIKGCAKSKKRHGGGGGGLLAPHGYPWPFPFSDGLPIPDLSLIDEINELPPPIVDVKPQDKKSHEDSLISSETAPHFKSDDGFGCNSTSTTPDPLFTIALILLVLRRMRPRVFEIR